MCMEDIRIARSTTTSSKVVNATSDEWTRILPFNPDRFSVLISAVTMDGAIVIPYSMGEPPVPTTQTTTPFVELLMDLNHHGDMVRQPFFAFPVNSSARFFVIETVLDAQ